MTIKSPNTTGGSKLATGLKRIWQHHHQTVCARAASVADAVSLLQRNQLTLDFRGQAVNNAHKLAGNLGTFGHPEGSEHARALELALQSSGSPSVGEIQTMVVHARELQTAIAEIAAAMDAAEPTSIEILPSSVKGRPNAR